MGIPLRPDPGAFAEIAITALTRACIAVARHRLDKTVPPAEIARRSWGDESRGVEYLLRAASQPAQTHVPGWAAELAQVVSIFLPSLGRLSAGAELLGLGLQLAFDRSAAIRLPLILPAQAAFVGEGKPIPVVGFNTSPSVLLEPKKLASIAVLTRETLDSSNAEAIVRQVLAESVANGLDTALFSTSAGSVDQPPGLLNGVTPVTAATSGQMIDDLAALAAAVARVAGAGPIVLVAAPEQAASIALRYLTEIDLTVLTSSALPKGAVVAIAANALACAFGGTPMIEARDQAEVVMNDTPGEVVTVGGMTGAPIASLFQSDSVGLKVRWPVSWVLRAPGAVAFVQGVTW